MRDIVTQLTQMTDGQLSALQSGWSPSVGEEIAIKEFSYSGFDIFTVSRVLDNGNLYGNCDGIDHLILMKYFKEQTYPLKSLS